MKEERSRIECLMLFKGGSRDEDTSHVTYTSREERARLQFPSFCHAFPKKNKGDFYVFTSPRLLFKDMNSELYAWTCNISFTTSISAADLGALPHAPVQDRKENMAVFKLPLNQHSPLGDKSITNQVEMERVMIWACPDPNQLAGDKAITCRAFEGKASVHRSIERD